MILKKKDMIIDLEKEDMQTIEKIDAEEILNKNNKYALDFSDVKGQENVKRALEISAAGGHNVLLIRLSSVLAKQC